MIELERLCDPRREGTENGQVQAKLSGWDKTDSIDSQISRLLSSPKPRNTLAMITAK